MPFALPAGAQSQPILGDPLPDIFGASTSFMSNRPLSPTPVASKPLESSPVFSRPSPGIKPPSPVSSIPSPTAKPVETAPVVSRPNPVISVPPTSRPSPIGSIPSPTAAMPSVRTSAVNGSPMSHASEEPATDDDDLSSAADETVSPEGMLHMEQSATYLYNMQSALLPALGAVLAQPCSHTFSCASGICGSSSVL